MKITFNVLCFFILLFSLNCYSLELNHNCSGIGEVVWNGDHKKGEIYNNDTTSGGFELTKDAKDGELISSGQLKEFGNEKPIAEFTIFAKRTDGGHISVSYLIYYGYLRLQLLCGTKRNTGE